ncbi:MAG: alpha/beta fold hydrolase [Chromatiales bacterium]|nr:alpha/beta fold hydrolase [Chromatiales bacterium]
MSVRLEFREHGAGEPLVILHGLFGSGANWNSIARRLGSRFRVLLPDLRNHGASPHVDEMSYLDMAGDLGRFLEDHRIRPAHILGHSMGGKVAMTFALLHPSLVQSLIVADIAPITYEHDYDWVLGPLEALDLANLRDRRDADERLARDIPDVGLRGFLLQNLRQQDGSWRWRINLPVLRRRIDDIRSFPDFSAEERNFRGNTLFLYGAKSGYVSEAMVPGILRLFPDAHLHAIEGAGHWLHAERPAQFLLQVERFLVRGR